MQNNLYTQMIARIYSMDEQQLIEFFHDLLSHSNIETIERIADTAYWYVENYVEPEIVDRAPCSDEYELDCKQRAQDMQSEITRNY
jgi:hypothetical protein